MTKLSITEAAKQAGICRQYLYTKYIKPGKLSVCKDEKDRPYIDAAELLRVFDGRLPGPKATTSIYVSSQAESERSTTPVNDNSNAGLHAEVKALREQLHQAQEREKDIQAAAQAREQWLQSQVEKLTDTIRQIEHKPAPEQTLEPTRRGWLSRFFGRA